jgi:hypothetical protein
MADPGAPLRWERLDWDSEFFGVPIGKADLDGATPEALAVLDDEARAAGIRCLYGLHDPTDPLLSGVVQAGGWLLVEMLSRFQIDPDDPVHLDETGCTVRRGTPEDLPAIRDSVLTMAPWSRYAVDRHFGVPAAERMHLAWVERASRGTTDTEHHLLVAEDDTGLLAFITRRRAPGPIIETIGTVAPGAGAAHALVNHSRQWADGEPLSAGWAPARNVSCFRSFVRFGFRVAEVRYQYHRLLD